MENVAFLFLVVVACMAQDDLIRIQLDKGEVIGYYQLFNEPRFTKIDRRVATFKGVPYAEQALRFQPPLEKEAWTTPYNATFYRYACLQPNLHQNLIADDCLYLNIFAPERQNLGVRLPVMVYIHGSDFGSGAASDFTDGTALAAMNDVIVVTFNYRLGPYGFITSESGLIAGNNGLLDQAMALRWVRENIEDFGGDSGNVTVFGDGSGAASITLHMVSPVGQNLFDRAIIQSGSFYSYWAFEPNRTLATIYTAVLAERLGCNAEDGHGIIQCLNRTDPNILLATSSQMFSEGKRFVPVVDYTYIPELPWNLLDRGEFANIPVMLGTNRDAGTRDIMFLKPDYINSEYAPRISKEEFYYLYYVSGVFNNDSYTIANALSYAVRQEYVDLSRVHRPDFDYFNTGVSVHSDVGWTCPSLNFTWSLLKSNISANVWFFKVTFVPKTSIFSLYQISQAKWLGSTLQEELQLIFGMAFGPIADKLNASNSEQELAIQVMKYWTNFAKSGNPNLPDLSATTHQTYQEWTNYTFAYQWYLNINENVTLADGIKANMCYFWNGYIPFLRNTMNELAGYGTKGDYGDDNEVSDDWRYQFEDWQKSHEEWKDAFEKYQEDRCD